MDNQRLIGIAISKAIVLIIVATGVPGLVIPPISALTLTIVPLKGAYI